MADRDEKIFPALPQKRQRAREEGHIARSRDLTSAISFVAAILFMAGATSLVVQLSIGRVSPGAGGQRITRLVRRDGPRARMATRGRLRALTGTGWRGGRRRGSAGRPDIHVREAVARSQPTQPNKLFRAHLLIRGPGRTGQIVSQDRSHRVGRLEDGQWGLDLAAGAHDIAEGLSALAAASRRIVYISATIALVAAAGDYAHKRYEHETELRMTRQEFLDQLKSDEGNPLVKRAIRKAQRAASPQARRRHPSGRHCNRSSHQPDPFRGRVAISPRL